MPFKTVRFFIFLHQTANFVCEAGATDVPIKAEKDQSEGNETDIYSPPGNQMTSENTPFLTVGSSKCVNYTHCFLIIKVNTHSLFVRLGPTIL